METKINIKVIYESKGYLVISKPVGIAVHPGADRESFTVMDWLCEQYPEVLKQKWLSSDRIGIVHRLDKNTSGLMILAKTPQALDFFQDQFRNREVEKYYQTLVCGELKSKHGFVAVDIFRDPKDRKKQTAEAINFGLSETERKKSASEYWVERDFKYKNQILSLLKVRIFTGRKHQIRVHMKYEGYPVVGDPAYNTKPSKRLSKELGIGRQFLHAYKLKVLDFETKKPIEFTDDIPQDLLDVIEKIS
ncbi:MAG: RluA family pseudouridine synthase [Candidatus Berkelbacteria bacterium]|nr:RluA family pseudouridine synthase [Candidatus Berkelbacteria bacterium]